MNHLIAVVVDGLIYSSWLFVIAVGLTLIYGVMKILNIAHGSLYALGAYTSVTFAGQWIAGGYAPIGSYGMLLAAAIVVGLIAGPVIERGLLNEQGRISGRAQSAVRPLAEQDFNRIIDTGLADDQHFLPRLGEPVDASVMREEQTTFQYEQARERMSYYGTRIIRDRIFRKVVLGAYGSRCAFTGLKLINGRGRAEVEAAHIRPVEARGPDFVGNGLALSGTVHWMFDRGLISLDDDLKILVSRQLNDRQGVDAMLLPGGYALHPLHSRDRPHPRFLRWHRDYCFKQ